MIKLGILDLSGQSECEIISLSEDLVKSLDIEMEKKKSQKANAQSIFARLLLTEVYKTFENAPMPKIIKGEKGKPVFLYDGGRMKEKAEDKLKEISENRRLLFNISHDKNMVAVAVSDTQDVGVDIQSKKENMRSRERIEKTLSSLLDGVNFSEPCEISEDTELLFYRLSDDGDVILYEDAVGERLMSSLGGALSEADADFLTSWTRLESLLKLSGGGFADSGVIKETALTARTQSFFMKDESGEIYSLTLSDYQNSSLPL